MPTVTAQAELPKSLPVDPVRQPNTIEPALEAAKEATPAPQEDAMSPKFAALARKEKALRAQLQELKSREDALKIKESEYQQNYIPKDKLREAAIEALKSGQISYEEFTQEMLKEGTDPTIAKLQAEIAELRTGQGKIKSEAEERTTKEYQQALKQIKDDTTAFVASNPDFDTIKSLGQEDAVVALIETTFKEEGRMMTIEEAAKEVEDYLVEEALKMAALSKVKLKLAPPPVPAEDPKLQQAQKSQPIKTLTNAQVASSSQPTSAKERRERAIAAFKGQLK